MGTGKEKTKKLSAEQGGKKKKNLHLDCRYVLNHLFTYIMQGFCLTSERDTCIRSALAFKFPGCEQGDWLIIDMPQKKSHIIIMRYVYILLLICQCSLGLNHHRQKNKIFMALTASEITLFLSRSLFLLRYVLRKKVVIVLIQPSQG